MDLMLCPQCETAYYVVSGDEAGATGSLSCRNCNEPALRPVIEDLRYIPLSARAYDAAAAAAAASLLVANNEYGAAEGDITRPSWGPADLGSWGARAGVRAALASR